ncbi:MAG: glutamate racemase [Sulfuricurvum sp. MLSB]|uniref:glutamate racemase n=1 Tax=unclassified Sulfuricurvum TaxID=2632390 RepID=UPI0005065FA1|nr:MULTISPECIES: glutamate racemase [unclassified Sulfuricurvum]KFN40425.1 MAG: glutamate racemase [Sulfuricurvum sp. MLSB]
MRVGVFDSGVGGLSVVKSLLEHKLFEEIIYFGDTARVPYGVKDPNTIIRYSLEALEFFKNFEIDLLITACNTVSAYALEEMREHSDCDVIGVVDPGVLALKNAVPSADANILILGTKATVKSGAYEKGLGELGYKNLSAIATSLLVPIVEEGLYEGDVLQSALHHYFGSLPKAPDAVILGCTHFPLVARAIGEYFEGQSTLIHSGEAIVEYLESHYDFTQRFEKTELKFFASENPEGLRRTAKEWLNLA